MTDLTIGCSAQAANSPDDQSNPRGNCYSGERDDLGFILKLIQHANTVAINIAAELIRHDDMPSDDREDYDRKAPQWLLRDIARAKDAHFARGKKLKDHCIDKLDAAVALMGVVTDRSKTDGNTVTLETDAPTIDHAALFKAFAQDIVKHANNILSNYTLTRLEYPDDLVEHWLTYLPSEYLVENKSWPALSHPHVPWWLQ